MRRVVFLALLALLLPAISASAETPAEEQMARRIGNEIKQSGQLHNYQITVKFHDGTAFLEGTIASVEQRTAAVQIAKHIKGVQRVQYKLEIPSDSEEGADAKSEDTNERHQPAEALKRTSFEPNARQNSDVMQAYQPYGDQARMAMQQRTMMPNRQMSGMGSPRNNMPLPARA